MIHSIFPNLFDFALIADTLLRITLGAMVLRFAYIKFFRERRTIIARLEHIFSQKTQSVLAIIVGVEAVLGVMMILGIYTQVVALVLGILLLVTAIINTRKPSLFPHQTTETYIILAVISFSLLFLGPGVLAFDMYL